ncbi:MAG: GNAT family N-acetyltransferase [Rhizobiaceae bacterium]
MIIETERTILRNWHEGDLPAFHRLLSDPKIMELFPLKRTLEECVERMAFYQKAYDEGDYWWASIELKETSEVVGIAGLLKLDYEEGTRHAEYEIGWRLVPEMWGKGLATEAATGWMNYAFDTLNQETIIATAVHQNAGSIAVMKRLGMSCEIEAFQYPGIPDSHEHLQPSVLYKITRDEWQKQKRLEK